MDTSLIEFGVDECVLFDGDCDSVVKQTEPRILKSNHTKDEKRFLASRLYRWKRKNLISRLNSSSIMIDRIKKIVDNPNFTVDDEYVYCNLFIPITSIITASKTLVSLDDNTIKHLVGCGYGISKFKLEKMFTIRDVWCIGKHPNVNPTDSTLCIDSELSDSPLTIDNLLLLADMMMTANIASSYINEDDDDFNTSIRRYI